MTEDKVYSEIKDQIQHDMDPVRVLAPIRKRVLPLLLIWPILTGLVLIVFGLRSDAELLGPWITWGLPVVQLLAAYTIVALALRLTIPGSSVSPFFLAFLALAGIALHFGISELVFRLSPIRVEAGREMSVILVCFPVTLVLGLIPALFVILLSRQGMVSRPLFLGLVCGLGCGLSGEAIWRIHCPYNSWDHILKAHSGAILAAGLIGFLIGFLFLRRRRRKIRL